MDKSMRNRRTISLDLRERILEAYDEGEVTRDHVARRFRVSLGMVKKLLQQRRHNGDIRARHHLAGRKPLIVDGHREKMASLLKKKPDLTLKELREAVGLKCSLQAMHVVLVKMEMTLKKRRSAPASKTARTSPGSGKAGNTGKAASIRRGWSSSTNREPRRT
jgi:transposase